MYKYRTTYLTALGLLAIPAAIGQAALVSVATSSPGGADTGILSASPTSNYASSVQVSLEATPNTSAVLLKFPVGYGGSERTDASLIFRYKRNNASSLALYGLKDGDAGEGWSESSGITYSNIGWFSSTSPTLVPDSARLEFIANLATPSTSVPATYTFGGSTALDEFLSADTDGQVTVVLISTSARPLNPFYLRESTEADPTLSFTVPEPASLGTAGVSIAAALRRRVRSAR